MFGARDQEAENLLPLMFLQMGSEIQHFHSSSSDLFTGYHISQQKGRDSCGDPNL